MVRTVRALGLPLLAVFSAAICGGPVAARQGSEAVPDASTELVALATLPLRAAAATGQAMVTAPAGARSPAAPPARASAARANWPAPGVMALLTEAAPAAPPQQPAPARQPGPVTLAQTTDAGPATSGGPAAPPPLQPAPAKRSAPAAQTTYRAAVIRVDVPGRLPISRLDLEPPDLGLAGAALADADNATTGAFLKQRFSTETVVTSRDAAEAEMRRLAAAGISYIVTLADDETTLRLADAAGPGVLVVNAGAHGDRLRGADCRANLVHVVPSDAILADALAQFLVWKRWTRWFLISGSHPEDQALADAYRRAARKFGARIAEDRTYEDRGGARRTDSGQVPGQREMPVFTQRAAAHDVVVVADRAGVFADYLPYQTWDPRPLTGSAGLEPVSWTPAHEAWGATQWQSRFKKLAGRPGREEDYQVWMALRALGEAATRTGSEDPAVIADYISSGRMELAAFKGQKLTIRDWDGQLRQPVLLAAGPVVATVSPQAEFLHQVSQLDTLGIDRPETECRRRP